MPWTPKDAKGHTRAADTPKLQRMWADIANSVLKKNPKDDARAIMEANAMVRKERAKEKA